ncbi:MAG: polymerase, sigma-24 subunit, subfamily [Candidatus Angelobacter sp.]|nr:polymerase, sigma-24 subunit, subfamily [Candidatus Angelobacter sp.]
MQCYDATAISIMRQACVVECCVDERQLAAGMSPQNTCSIQLLTVVSFDVRERTPVAAQSTSVASCYPAAKTARDEAIAIIPQMGWQDLTDEALIARYRAEAGQAEAEQYLNELFRRHHVKVARWCLSVTGDRESAADLAQEICVKAYQNLSYFKGQSKFSTWLYSITRNHCLNAVRSRASVPAMDSDELVMDTLPDVKDSPLASVERKQQADIARQLINETLEETEKAVFTMHFGEELPLDVITRMLNLTNASGAKAFLVSAKRKLDKAAKRWKARA